MKLVTFTTTGKNFTKPNKYRQLTSSFAKVKKKKTKADRFQPVWQLLHLQGKIDRFH